MLRAVVHHAIVFLEIEFLLFFLIDLFAISEINLHSIKTEETYNLEVEVLSDEYVLWLKVAMHNLLSV